MAKIFLNVDEDTDVAGDGAEVFGQSGQEGVTLLDDLGYTGLVLDQNIEEIGFQGNFDDYTFQQQGIKLKVTNNTGDLVATLSVQNDDNGTQLTFADGTVDAVFGDNNEIIVGNERDEAVSEATAGAPLDAGGGDVTFEIQAGAYTQEIINFTAGDVLDFPEANAPTLVQNDFDDGVVGVQYAVSEAETMIVELTGLDPAVDAQLLGVADLDAVFGEGTVI